MHAERILAWRRRKPIPEAITARPLTHTHGRCAVCISPQAFDVLGDERKRELEKLEALKSRVAAAAANAPKVRPEPAPGVLALSAAIHHEVPAKSTATMPSNEGWICACSRETMEV